MDPWNPPPSLPLSRRLEIYGQDDTGPKLMISIDADNNVTVGEIPAAELVYACAWLTLLQVYKIARRRQQ